MSHPGLGVLINNMIGNASDLKALKRALGKRITALNINDDVLEFKFEDDTFLNVWDGGQSCCEHRYMSTDDELSDFVGAVFVDIEITSCQSLEVAGEESETQFLEIITDKGVFTIVNHNEHNGYYGGFSVRMSS